MLHSDLINNKDEIIHAEIYKFLGNTNFYGNKMPTRKNNKYIQVVINVTHELNVGIY